MEIIYYSKYEFFIFLILLNYHFKMRSLFSIRKTININFFDNLYSRRFLYPFQKFNFARKFNNTNKQTLDSFNKENESNIDEKDLINDEFYESENFNLKNSILKDEQLINNKHNNINYFDNSIKRKTFTNKPSLNVNKNLDFLNSINQDDLKREEKRINKILKKFDTPEFEEYLKEKSSQGLNDEDIFNELFSGKGKGNKLKFSDLDNLQSLSVDKKFKTVKKNKDESIIDIDNSMNQDSNNLEEEFANLKKELEKRKNREGDIGPEVKIINKPYFRKNCFLLIYKFNFLIRNLNM